MYIHTCTLNLPSLTSVSCTESYLHVLYCTCTCTCSIAQKIHCKCTVHVYRKFVVLAVTISFLYTCTCTCICRYILLPRYREISQVGYASIAMSSKDAWQYAYLTSDISWYMYLGNKMLK